jgi:hypothetical protein
MNSFTLAVTYNDGTDDQTGLTLDDWCSWEEWSGKSFQQLGENTVGARDLAFLAWTSFARTGKTRKTFEEWRKEVASLPTLAGQDTRPTGRGRSGGSASK